MRRRRGRLGLGPAGGYFRTSPGGYFHGMVAKAKAGELNLVRTIWGLRQAKAARERVPRAMH